jgi:hypothetical protein
VLGDLAEVGDGVAHLRVEVLDRARHVAGDDLLGVVEHRQQRGPLGIDRPPAEALVLQQRQRVGDHRHLQAVLLDVLGRRVAHEAPALDELHAGEVGEEVTHGAS